MYVIEDIGLKLKECPFCGAEPKAEIMSIANGSIIEVNLFCPNCGTKTKNKIVGRQILPDFDNSGQRVIDVPMWQAFSELVNIWNNRI